MATDLPPANWYPAPGDATKLRYWDGAQWTEHYAPASAPVEPGNNKPRGKLGNKDWWFGKTPEQVEKKQMARARLHEAMTHGTAGAGVSETQANQPIPKTANAPARAVHIPELPGQPIDAWATAGVTSEDIIGESNYKPSFQALLKEYGRTADQGWGVELPDAHAVLVTEPDNKFDPDAVAVWIDGRHLVGYLPRGMAARYAPKLATLERDGHHLRVPARVWIATEQSDDRVGSVSVRVPTPDGISAFNDFPDEPYVVLPPGKAMQVYGEEDHMDVLRGFALGGPERHVAATLHLITETKPRGEVHLVEVQLDGHRVGALTKAMGDQIRDLVAFASDHGRTPVVRAVLKGSDLRADLTIYVARTIEVPQKWLNSITSA